MLCLFRKKNVLAQENRKGKYKDPSKDDMKDKKKKEKKINDEYVVNFA